LWDTLTCAARRTEPSFGRALRVVIQGHAMHGGVRLGIGAGPARLSLSPFPSQSVGHHREVSR